MSLETDDLRYRRSYDAVKAFDCCRSFCQVFVPAVPWEGVEFQDFRCLERK